MRSIRKSFAIMLIVFIVLCCTACSGFDNLSDNLKGGVGQLGDNVAIGKSNALITPYQSFEGKRTSDNAAFLATYDATVDGFDGQDILVANTDLKEKDCREITVTYEFTSISGTCQLIYISPDLEETVLADNGNSNIKVKLKAGANYIGITGAGYAGTIQITVE